MARPDKRQPDQLRPVSITPGFFAFAEGSVLIEMGQTRVACAASIEEKVPPFLLGKGKGWVTAEYAMLPRSTPTRNQREATKGRLDGRSVEIQRLIGRSLRAAIDTKALGERTITIDCDVLQADGGTRTAAITGAYVALRLACERLVRDKALPRSPLRHAVAAVSAGIVRGVPLLDLCYAEDSQADVDFNVVMTDAGDFVEVQGSAEGAPFSPDAMTTIIEFARKGIGELLLMQAEVK